MFVKQYPFKKIFKSIFIIFSILMHKDKEGLYLSPFHTSDGVDINEMLFFVHGFLTSLFTVF